MLDINNLTPLGVLVLLGYFFWKEFFAYLSRKNGNGSKNGKNVENTKRNNLQDIEIAKINQTLKFFEKNHFKSIKDWQEKHDKEHKEDRELLYKIAGKLGVEK